MAERQANKWMVGSDYFRRTQDFDARATDTASGAGTMRQVAISYRGTGGGAQVVTGCLRGTEMGSYTVNNTQGFGPDVRALFGPRSAAGDNSNGGVMNAHIDESRVYNRALTCAEVADTDMDGLIAEADNCPADANPAQTDTDGDGKGDACDPRRSAARGSSSRTPARTTPTAAPTAPPTTERWPSMARSSSAASTAS